MLNLIFGRSKSGKTTFVDNKVKELVENGESKILVIVPDQITFETEKSYLTLLGPKFSQNVLVLGFSRMCDYVYEKSGVIRNTPADDCTKALLMSIALEEVKDNLTLYSDKALSPELAKLMLSARKELSLSGSMSENILTLSDKTQTVTANKLKDIYLASVALDSLIAESFEDPDAELSIVADILRQRPVFDGYHIFIDSYLSFTAPETDVLSVLMSQCKDMYVALSYDGVSRDGIFSVSGDTASKLRRMAESEGISIGEPLLCTYDGFYKTPELSHLEQNIFMDDGCVFDEDADSITLYRAKNRYDEIDFVAREIRRLIIDGGYRYNQIAVVGRNLSSYSSVIDTIFDKYEISYFADKPHDIMSKPLVKLITSCFNAVFTGFDKDDIMNILKTGLTSLDNYDISMFENYVYTWQINYSTFKDDFKANPRGFADEFTFEDIDILNRAEGVRSLLMPALVRFKENTVDKSAEDICKALYALLLDLGADRKLLELSETYEEWDEASYSSEQIRLWDIFVETLDRTADIIGGRVLTLKRFYDLLLLQFSFTDISFIPKAVDQVTVGDIERLRLGGRDCVFVIGAVDGEFPRAMSESGIFTCLERAELSKLNVLDYADDEQTAQRELYLAYYALTSASDRLFVSYPAAELKGDANTPSVLFTDVHNMFSSSVQRSSATEDTAELLWAPKAAYDYFANNIRSKDGVTESLRNYYINNEVYKDKLLSLENVLASKARFNIKNTKLSQELFGKNIHLSASKIERYHLCRFSYFCQYGLKAKERRKASMDALEYGSFVHYILENFFKAHPKSELSTLSKNDIKVCVRDISDSYAKMHFGGIGAESSRFMYLYNAINDSTVVLINHLIEELLQSEFTPADYELDIGKDISAYRLELENGVTVTVTGKVDRADIMQKDGKSYIRIIDYKTGTKVFSLSDVIYGLNLQMLLYLSVINSKGADRFGDNIIPAGVLYMPAFVPTVEMAIDSTDEDVSNELNKKLRMNGILLNDCDVLASMDKEMRGLYIPVSMGAKGLKGTDNLATLEEFGAIFAHIDKLISMMAEGLLSGNVDATPATDSFDACKWCPYNSVCIGRDEEKTHRMFKLDREEILRELGIEKKEVQ